jgi:hypothetical protein
LKFCQGNGRALPLVLLAVAKNLSCTYGLCALLLDGDFDMDLPKLYFKKVHKSTGSEFVDCFSSKNCEDWLKTPLEDLHIRARQRIKHWNECLIDWNYSIVGWNVEGLEP